MHTEYAYLYSCIRGLYVILASCSTISNTISSAGINIVVAYTVYEYIMSCTCMCIDVCVSAVRTGVG